jgi:uncharacterized protein YdiU (UPF0061 family)
VFSSIDEGGRYAYGNQPVVAQWNLARLAESMLPLLHDDQEQAVAGAQEVLGTFVRRFDAAWTAGMRAKLGLPDDVNEAVLVPLVNDLLALLREGHVDYTSFFRSLGKAARGDSEPARSQVLDLAAIDAWTARWLALHPDADAMDRVNPIYIARNHLVEQALAAASDDDDLAPLGRLLAAIAEPCTERPGFERYAEPAPTDFGQYRTFCGT